VPGPDDLGHPVQPGHAVRPGRPGLPDPLGRTGVTDLADLADADRELAALLALSAVEGIGSRTVLACHRGGGAIPAWRALQRDAIDAHPALSSTVGVRARARAVASARDIDPAAEFARCRDAGVRVLVEGRPGYPERLLDDPAPPAVLFATGPVPGPARPTVAIVGTRNATGLGRSFARRLGEELTEVGVSVVSGLALGIDGAAHRGAVDVHDRSGDVARPRPAPPIGVVAAGLDLAYPARHERLHREVASAGVLLSETPIGRRPAAWRFPARNRIIAGLSDAVVVVESRATGGSLITVDEANRRGVTVLAVPGHPAAPSAVGTNALLFDGASVVRDADDVLGALGLPTRSEPADGREGARPPRADTSEQPSDTCEQRIVDRLVTGPLSLGELVAASGRSVDDVAAALTALEVGGRVAATGGWFELVAGPGRGPRR